MRIVAGALRGRPLVGPKGQSTRPTADRTRQAIFNVLEHAPWAPDFEGARVLDLFAGAGGMGLEALSRGAAFCRFVERGETAVAAVRANVARLGVGDRVGVERRDATLMGPRGLQPAFDLVFVDPPYGEGLGEAALTALLAGDWLCPDAVVILERGRRDPTASPAGYRVIDERTWGAARVSFLGLA